MNLRTFLSVLILFANTSMLSQCLEDNIFLHIDFQPIEYESNDSLEVCLDEIIHLYKTAYPEVMKHIVIYYSVGPDLTNMGKNIMILQDYFTSKGINPISYRYQFNFRTEKSAISDSATITVVLMDSP